MVIDQISLRTGTVGRVGVDSVPRMGWDRELRDLTTGTVHKKESSIVKEQNEVAVMIEATKKEGWPGAQYEFIQGALDNNDWERGPVELKIYTEGGGILTLDQFKHGWDRGERFPVTKYTIENYIKDGSGLRPGHVVLTMHEQAEEANTLGEHGRGLSFATIASSTELADHVTFESYRGSVGAWYGEAKMTADLTDPELPPNLSLHYKCDRGHVLDKTIVSVIKPTGESLNALAAFPDWFLLVNPAYEYCKLDNLNYDYLKERN